MKEAAGWGIYILVDCKRDKLNRFRLTWFETPLTGLFAVLA